MNPVRMSEHQRGVADALVLSEIKSGNVRATTIASAIKGQLDLPKTKHPMRAVDEALQRLRKAGMIRKLRGKYGWEATKRAAKA